MPPSQVAAPPVFQRSPGQVLPGVPETPASFLRLIEQIGADRLVFASDYAHWDWDAPDTALPARLPDEVRRKIYYENARELYRL